MPKQNLIFRTIEQITGFILIVSGWLFIPAGTLNYPQGWGFIAAFLIPTVLITVYLFKFDRHLLEKRLSGKEKSGAQKFIMTVISLIMMAAFIVPGLDFRFGWSKVPAGLTIISDLVIIGSFGIVFQSFKVNTFTSKIIEVEKGQAVISAGLYKFIRHPMYLGAFLIIAFTPFALGSYWTLPAFVPILPFFIMRILNEEKTLKKELPGYTDYCSQTPYRLIPGVW